MCTITLNTMEVLEGLFRNLLLLISRILVALRLRAFVTSRALINIRAIVDLHHNDGKRRATWFDIWNPGTTVIDNYLRKIRKVREERTRYPGFYDAKMWAAKMRSRRIESHEINDPWKTRRKSQSKIESEIASRVSATLRFLLEFNIAPLSLRMFPLSPSLLLPISAKVSNKLYRATI